MSADLEIRSAPVAPPAAPARALVIGDHEWTALALEAVLAGDGWQAERVTAQDAAGHLGATPEPDVVILTVRWGDARRRREAIELCCNVRAHGLVGAGTPAIFVTFDAIRRDDLLAAYEAGAWEVCQLPLDAALLRARLRGWRGVRPGSAAPRPATPLLDEETGLYTARGLLHRAAELTADAVRTERPLACVALALDRCPPPLWLRRPGARPERGAPAGEGADHDRLYARLVARVRGYGGRASDVFGHTGGGEFAVLAPGATADDARRLARRLTQLLLDQWAQVAAGAAGLGDPSRWEDGALSTPGDGAAVPRWGVAELTPGSTPHGAAAALLGQATAALRDAAGAGAAPD